MKIDRALQLEILEILSDHYAGLPQIITTDIPDEEEKYIANLLYLEDNGLITSGLQQGIDGYWSHGGSKITAAGLDFLSNDGGLSAILGVVTVKLHDETIRDLVAARIQGSDLPTEEKTGLLAQLRELRGESIKHLTLKLLDKGAENLPVILDAIRTSLPGG